MGTFCLVGFLAGSSLIRAIADRGTAPRGRVGAYGVSAFYSESGNTSVTVPEAIFRANDATRRR